MSYLSEVLPAYVARTVIFVFVVVTFTYLLFVSEVPHLVYLFASYTIIWLAIFAYVVSLSRKQKRLEQELATLRNLLEALKST